MRYNSVHADKKYILLNKYLIIYSPDNFRIINDIKPYNYYNRFKIYVGPYVDFNLCIHKFSL